MLHAHPRGRLAIVCFSLLLLSLASCNKGDDRQRVYGSVSIGGQPIRGGFVLIDPASDSNRNGRQGRAAIRDGRFDTRDGGEMAISGS